MWGRTVNPRSTAFLASRPAAIMTLGLEVLVHEVMAAISTSPEPTSTPGPAGTRFASVAGGRPKPLALTGALYDARKRLARSGRAMRSCGRLGPATEGTMPARSSLMTCE